MNFKQKKQANYMLSAAISFAQQNKIKEKITIDELKIQFQKSKEFIKALYMEIQIQTHMKDMLHDQVLLLAMKNDLDQ